MIGENDKRPCADVLRLYQAIVTSVHPDAVRSWPLLNGWNLLGGTFGAWGIAILKDAGFSGMTRHSGLGELDEEVVGFAAITDENREAIRAKLERHFNLGVRDAVFLFSPDADYSKEYEALMIRHERALGLSPMRIFLSHKGFDKPRVRDFRNIFKTLGFDPWLDEDAMPAGTSLERGILAGFENSCAAVFFITPSFKDEGYLASEVEYAIAQKRKKGDRFAIITLVFGDGVAKGTVPDLLHNYVWKEPISDIEAVQEIVRALPIEVGRPKWR